MDIFYHAMNYISKGIIDAACYGAFKRKSAEKANQLIKDLAKSNHKAPSKALGSSNRLRSGVIDLNKMTAIEAKLDALISRLSHHKKISHSTNEVGTRDGAEHKCVYKGLAQEGPYQMEEIQYLNGNRSYNFKPNNNLPTHYTRAFRNHENMSYGGGVQ